ncbi:AraC family transcriptional regulator [Desulfosarcina widdelii]|nr:AraC family transcriptional regulator [Desulfosarcina widdelii]
MKAAKNVIFWRDAQIADLEICQVSASKHVFPNHAHDGIYAVGMMMAGGAYCLGPEKSYSLVSPGQVALINPGQIHSGVPACGSQTYRMIYFNMKRMAAAAAEITGRPVAIPEFACMVVGDPLLWKRLQRLCRVIQGPAGRLEKETAVMDAMVHLVTHYGNVKPARTDSRREGIAIERARDYLSANLDRKVSLEDAAQEAGLSRYHFLRVFKRETGFSPHLFRTLRRIDRARQLLRKGLAPVQTALAVGFSDQSHFSNTFRKYTGATPGQYLSQS